MFSFGGLDDRVPFTFNVGGGGGGWGGGKGGGGWGGGREMNDIEQMILSEYLTDKFKHSRRHFLMCMFHAAKCNCLHFSSVNKNKIVVLTK